MRVPSDLNVGVASHTGRVRNANEDDYLLLVPEAGAATGSLFVIADGMGGTLGGAEASRAAVRALGAAFLAAPPGDPGERMQYGFAAACTAVYELSRANPALRGMGTTLTALHLADGASCIGHVGDTRCLLLRGARFEQLTTDHALRGETSHLTRCIGGGREHETVDVATGEVQPGDVFLLATDGLWSVVPDELLASTLRQLEPQAAAQALVRLANQAGGPDNCTAIVVRVRAPRPGAAAVELELPREESRFGLPALRTGSLRRPLWPWLLLVLALALGAMAVAKGVFAVDVVELVRQLRPR